MNVPRKVAIVALILLSGSGVAWFLRPAPAIPKTGAVVAQPTELESPTEPEERNPSHEFTTAERDDYHGKLTAPIAHEAHKPVLSPENYPATAASSGTRQVEVQRLPPLPQSAASRSEPPSLAEKPTFPSQAGGAIGRARALPSSDDRGSDDHVLMHRIVDGDSLPGLAQRYLGSADRAIEIFQQNRQLLTNMELLPLGKTLRIRGAVGPLRQED